MTESNLYQVSRQKGLGEEEEEECPIICDQYTENELAAVCSFMESPVSLLSLGQPSPLTALPDAICQLKKVTELILVWDQLTHLPVSFSQLHGLRKLDLSGNCFTEVPTVLFKLENLQDLDLSQNPIAELTIPPRNSSWSRLKKLRLDRTFLEDLPTTIGDLQCLESLQACHARLRSLPESIGSLQMSLQLLSVDYNSISDLPNCLVCPCFRDSL